MKKLITHIKIITLASVIFPLAAMSADILKTDRLYTEKKYEQAIEGYLDAAKFGNPHAYYQLATIYYKGLGVKKDVLNALIYFSLAAEYKFHDSQRIMDDMLANISPEEKKSVSEILATFNNKEAKQKIINTYFPIINEKNLTTKVTFEGEVQLEKKFFLDDVDNEDLNPEADSGFDDDEEGEGSFDLLLSTPKLPYVIIDNDIGVDGSIRNIFDVQKTGFSKTIIDEYKLFPTKKPDFKGQPVEFVHRSYMGAATYSKFTLLEENEKLYAGIRRTANKLKAGKSISDQYEYAMALLNFKWLTQEEGEAEKRLLGLSKKGHPGAMYEYGFKLYREQKNIKQAIHWISEASKYGLVRAEYRLANLLLTSPWIVKDEQKALFWLESAVDKNHSIATLKAIDLKLNATDEKLRDLDSAIEYLDRIKVKQANNPEYYYLLALSHKNRENRDYTKVVRNLERAIFMGQTANWDVSEWQALLLSLTTGSVYIND